MDYFDRHAGLFSFLALILAALVALSGLLLYFKDSGHSEGKLETNITSLDGRISKLENDYRMILSTLLNNNKAAVATIENSNIDPLKKRNLLQYFDNNSKLIKQYLMQKPSSTFPISETKEKTKRILDL